MSPSSEAARAAAFAALGDVMRLRLIGALSVHEARSITQLTDGAGMTRQAISKHLRVLEAAGLVASQRAGRESLYQLVPAPLVALRGYLETVSSQWDRTLARLKTFAEQDPSSF